MTDLSVTPASVARVANEQYGEGTAGATITAGQVVYEDASDSRKLKLADNGAAATAAAVGIAAHGASAGQPLKYFTGGTINPGATAAAGTVYVVSATAGGIAPVADLGNEEFVTVLGVGDGTNLKLALFVSGVVTPGA